MNPGSPNPMECSRFEPQWSEAVEGVLPSPEMQAFRLHLASCSRCAENFAEALAGRRWLEQLEDLEPPAHLLHNILAATSEKDLPLRQSAQTRKTRLQQLRDTLRMLTAPLLQPRLAGTFAMAFFSLTVLLNILGIHLGDVRKLDLRPQAVRMAISRNYYQGRAHVLRYYDNMKFVYELQAQLRDLRNALPQQQQSDERENKRKQHEERNQNRNISHDPEPKQERQYVQSDSGSVMAANFVNQLHSAKPEGFADARGSEAVPNAPGAIVESMARSES